MRSYLSHLAIHCNLPSLPAPEECRMIEQEKSKTLPHVYELPLTEGELKFTACALAYVFDCLNGDVIAALDSMRRMMSIDPDQSSFASTVNKVNLLLETYHEHEKEKK